MLKRTKKLISLYKLSIKNFKKQVEILEQERMDMYERILTVSADFENYKKRAAREQLSFQKFSNQELLQEILTIVDSIEKVIKYSNDSNTITGINFTLSMINTTLKKFNVEPIEATGKQFDPKFHQAMSLEENNEYPDNTILSELQKGYMIHDRLLRPSMVVVSTLKKGEK